MASSHVRTRAKNVLVNLANPDFHYGISFDGDGWVALGLFPEVGSKTLKYLLDEGKIERRGDTEGYSYKAMYMDRYRLLGG